MKKDGRALPDARPDGGCPFLDESGKRCTVYEDRPFGCRTFFCHRRRGPTREPAAAVQALLVRLERVAQAAFPEAQGPKQISEWYRSEKGKG
jgi:Fe-S-cluster containining protein